MPPLETQASLHDVEDVTGAFEIEVIARFDDVAGGYWQRILDFGNGPNSNNLLLTQAENSNDLMLALYQDGTVYRVIAENAIVEGETATWNVGIDPTGEMWINKDGVRLAEGPGAVPANTPRANELLGASNWAEDSALDGAVLGIDVTNLGEDVDGGRLNTPEQIGGPFQLDVITRFDDLSGTANQTVFEFGTGGDAVRLQQLGTSEDLRFTLVQDGVSYDVTAPDALVQGDWALWSVGIDPDGRMWLEKDGLLLTEGAGVVPAAIDRQPLLIGSSSLAEGGALDGVVMDLTIAEQAEPIDPADPTDPGDPIDPVDPTDPVAPLPPVDGPQQINGAFRIDATVRFDDVQGGSWQRVIDFGDGPGTNNILFSQVENSTDMVLELWQDGSVFRTTAPDAIVEGETANWSFGIDGSGLMWIDKDGTRLSEDQGVVPADVPRANLLVGSSNWPEDPPLIGEVESLLVYGGTPGDPTGPSDPVDPVDPTDPIDPGEPTDPTDPVDPIDPVDPTDPITPVDGPQQINGAFRIDATVRFDDVQGGSWQRVIDFGDGPGTNNILFSQVENSTDMVLELWQDGSVFRTTAPDAIVEGETANWSFGIDGSGLMWIDKDGTRLSEDQGVVPADVPRANLLVGSSNWPEDPPLIGEVESLLVYGGTPGDPTGPSDPVDPVDPTDPIDPGEPTDPTDPVVPPDPVSGTGDMFIVAHQDDDLLFMNPTLDDAIDGDGPVTTIYLTAGDAGQDATYWTGREDGEKAAYAYMSGSDDWVDETVSIVANGQTFDIESAYLASQPDIRLYFMRMPDGFGDGSGSGTYGFQSLEQLADGDISSLTTVDGSETYTAADVTAVLTGLMERHTPDHIHIQDHTTEYADIEHSDHVTTAAFATEAVADYSADLTVTSYVGYRSWGLEENLTPEQLEVVGTTFDTYAEFDPLVFGSDGALIGAYEDWVLREYVADEYTQSADAASASAAPAPDFAGLAFYEEMMRSQASEDPEIAEDEIAAEESEIDVLA